jgi:hypothetical protein
MLLLLYGLHMMGDEKLGAFWAGLSWSPARCNPSHQYFNKNQPHMVFSLIQYQHSHEFKMTFPNVGVARGDGKGLLRTTDAVKRERAGWHNNNN